jgi:hypothetical protein
MKSIIIKPWKTPGFCRGDSQRMPVAGIYESLLDVNRLKLTDKEAFDE